MGYNTFGDRVIQGVLYLLLVLYGYPPSGILGLGMEGSAVVVYVPGMLPIVLNEPGKAHIRAMMSWAAAVDGWAFQPD